MDTLKLTKDSKLILSSNTNVEVEGTGFITLQLVPGQKITIDGACELKLYARSEKYIEVITGGGVIFHQDKKDVIGCNYNDTLIFDEDSVEHSCP